MNEAEITQLNAGYQCPPDAGPAWREAFDAGIDMSLIELSLQQSVWERMREHDEALAFAARLRQRAQPIHGKA